MEAILSTNNVNNYSVSELNYIRENIESMNKFNQVEVLRILSKHQDVILNENKYGIHINISELKKEIIDELGVYIKYVSIFLPLVLYILSKLCSVLQISKKHL